jgi:hypothetical protein
MNGQIWLKNWEDSCNRHSFCLQLTATHLKQLTNLLAKPRPPPLALPSHLSLYRPLAYTSCGNHSS